MFQILYIILLHRIGCLHQFKSPISYGVSSNTGYNKRNNKVQKRLKLVLSVTCQQPDKLHAQAGKSLP